MTRTISVQGGTRTQAFTDAIRLRDRRCVITGQEYLDDDNWPGFEAAHIFPLAYEQNWASHNYGRWISILPDRGGSINSVQNGLLLRSDIHQRFDMYWFSINPDVSVLYFFLRNIANYLRIITRLYALHAMGMVLLESILTKDFSMIPKDQPMSSSVGTSGRRF